MRDLWIHDNDLIVATTAVFWILDDIAPLREVSTLAGTTRLLFKPARLRIQRDNYTDTRSADEPAGANPPTAWP